MASTHKAHRCAFGTPTGTAQYPHLNKADGKFEDPPKFKANLIVPKDQVKDMIADMKRIAEAALPEKMDRVRYPYSIDPDTGEMIMKVKTKLAPKFTDTTGALITEEHKPHVTGGSRLRLFGTLFTYDTGANCGVSAQLEAVQIIDLGSAGGSHNIGAVEGGSFVASAQPAPKQEANDATEEADYNF